MYGYTKPKTLWQYIQNVALGLDIFVNTLFAGRVRTISERIGEHKVKGTIDNAPFLKWLDIHILDPIDPNHSIDAYYNNLGYRYLEALELLEETQIRHQNTHQCTLCAGCQNDLDFDYCRACGYDPHLKEGFIET